MKIVPLSIAKSYVGHWSWWEGIRELLQNAVDTGDYDVRTARNEITITSRGGKIPISSLLMGKSSKEDDDSTIGKFGEGMKLAFLVLSRLGADVLVDNIDENWCPVFEYNETFQEDCLAVQITPKQPSDEVKISIKGIPLDVIELVSERFLPLSGRTPIYEAYNGEAYEKSEDIDGCYVYINGIFVSEVEGKYKFDYNFQPGAFNLDRDRNTAKDFEVKWEASRLLSDAGEFLLIAELAAEGYDDVQSAEYQSGYRSNNAKEMMNKRAVEMFFEKNGHNAWPINRDWDSSKKLFVSTKVIEGGFVPVEVPSMLYKLLAESFKLSENVKNMMVFRPIDYIASFLEKHRRNMRSKPVKELEKTLRDLKILQGVTK